MFIDDSFSCLTLKDVSNHLHKFVLRSQVPLPCQFQTHSILIKDPFRLVKKIRGYKLKTVMTSGVLGEKGMIFGLMETKLNRKKCMKTEQEIQINSK